MGQKLPDLTQHVARRVRVTRMFFGLSLEAASTLLDIPVWLLSYKESGLANFSHQDFQKLERLYKMSWKVFFQDYFAFDDFSDERLLSRDGGDTRHEVRQDSDVIVNYLATSVAEGADAGYKVENVAANFRVTVDNRLDATSSARWRA